MKFTRVVLPTLKEYNILKDKSLDFLMASWESKDEYDRQIARLQYHKYQGYCARKAKELYSLTQQLNGKNT